MYICYCYTDVYVIVDIKNTDYTEDVIEDGNTKTDYTQNTSCQ